MILSQWSVVTRNKKKKKNLKLCRFHKRAQLSKSDTGIETGTQTWIRARTLTDTDWDIASAMNKDRDMAQTLTGQKQGKRKWTQIRNWHNKDNWHKEAQGHKHWDVLHVTTFGFVYLWEFETEFLKQIMKWYLLQTYGVCRFVKNCVAENL